VPYLFADIAEDGDAGNQWNAWSHLAFEKRRSVFARR